MTNRCGTRNKQSGDGNTSVGILLIDFVVLLVFVVFGANGQEILCRHVVFVLLLLRLAWTDD